MFQPYSMDAMDLRRWQADTDNPKFQEKYTRWRKRYTCNGARQGGLDRNLLFLLADEFPLPEPKQPEPKKTEPKKTETKKSAKKEPVSV